MFFAAIPIIRKKHIIDKLLQAGAIFPATAKTLAEAGVINAEAFRMITKRLVKRGIIVSAGNGRYWLDTSRV